MTPYRTKLLHLIDEYIADLHFDGFETVRQHIEQGEPDCRTCTHFHRCNVAKTYSQRNPFTCVEFNKYKRADYTPLCETPKTGVTYEYPYGY